MLPLDEVVADVSVSHQGLPAPARRSRSGLAVDGNHNKGAALSSMAGRAMMEVAGSRWKSQVKDA